MSSREGLKSLFSFMVIVVLLTVVAFVMFAVTEQVGKSIPMEENSSAFNMTQSIIKGSDMAFGLVGIVFVIAIAVIILEMFGIDLRKTISDIF